MATGLIVFLAGACVLLSATVIALSRENRQLRREMWRLWANSEDWVEPLAAAMPDEEDFR